MDGQELIFKPLLSLKQNGTGSKTGGNVNFFILRRLESQLKDLNCKLRRNEQIWLELGARISELEDKTKKKRRRLWKKKAESMNGQDQSIARSAASNAPHTRTGGSVARDANSPGARGAGENPAPFHSPQITGEKTILKHYDGGGRKE